MLSLSSVNCRYSKLTNPKLDLTLLSGLEIFSIDSVHSSTHGYFDFTSKNIGDFKFVSDSISNTAKLRGENYLSTCQRQIKLNEMQWWRDILIAIPHRYPRVTNTPLVQTRYPWAMFEHAIATPSLTTSPSFIQDYHCTIVISYYRLYLCSANRIPLSVSTVHCFHASLHSYHSRVRFILDLDSTTKSINC